MQDATQCFEPSVGWIRGGLVLLSTLGWMAACKSEVDCPLPIENYCEAHCDDQLYWEDKCKGVGGWTTTDTDTGWSIGGCHQYTCGDYLVLSNSGSGLSGESWYLDAEGRLVAYYSEWEGDGPGVCGGSESYGYAYYGRIPEGC